MREAVRRLARWAGYDVRRFSPSAVAELRLVGLLGALGIDTVLDVGANEGQFASGLVSAGYAGRIVSFEPVAEPYRRLARRASRRDGWSTVQAALGEAPGRAGINVSRNSQISSLLPALPEEAGRIAQAETVGVEEIEVRTLHAVLAAVPPGALGRIALKMDVQGGERQVLKGGGALVGRLGCIHTEMSLRPFYAGEPEFRTLFDEILALGFRCVGLSAGYVDAQSCEVRQVDGTFVQASSMT